MGTSAKTWDTIWTNTRLLTMDAAGRMDTPSAIAVKDGKIAWLGSMDNANPANATTVHDAKGAWITPGFIDCHTHLVYAGNRAKEFEMRLSGVSYAEIAKAGGGIISTVRATRLASEQELFDIAAGRLHNLMAEGVTTIEIKSGYGLDLDSELKMLRVARKLGKEFPITVKTSFLGAHAIPPEFKDRADDYVSHLCEEILPAAAKEGLVDAVDAFCEHIGFSNVQTRRLFEAAKTLNLPVKLHAEQLSDQQGAELVAEFGGLSADHVEFVSDAGVAAMAKAGTVAVLLPAAFYFLKETVKPPIAKFREAGVKMAVATDSNPGTAPIESLLLAMNMACTCFGLTVQEVFEGVTINAASALGMEKKTGSLTIGKRADFVLWGVDEPAELIYRMGAQPKATRIFSGKITT